MVFGIGPVREITVFFKATDSAYAEVQRVLQIMIPEIGLPLDDPWCDLKIFLIRVSG